LLPWGGPKKNKLRGGGGEDDGGRRCLSGRNPEIHWGGPRRVEKKRVFAALPENRKEKDKVPVKGGKTGKKEIRNSS